MCQPHYIVRVTAAGLSDHHLQVRAWAEDMAAKRVLIPLEQAMPDQALPTRRSSVRASFSIGASASRSGDADLDARVSRLVGTCRAAAARIQDLESALKQ